MTGSADIPGTVRASWSWCGEAWTDGRGRAVVAVPPAAQASHRAFAYELRALEPGVGAALVEELRDGCFVLSTDRPHQKVTWRVTQLVRAGQRGGSGR